MWNRADLKARAKQVLKINYWKAFLVSLVITMVGGNSGGCSGSFSQNLGNNQGGGSGQFNGQLDSQLNGGFPGPGSEFWGWFLVGAAIVLLICLMVLAFRVLLGYPLEVGGRRYFVRSAQNSFDMNALGFGFEKPRYLNIVKAMLWRAFLNFLWYLLLFIPGIVKNYAYQMVPYILADNPEIGYKRAVELSNEMTRGHKFDMFVLDLSFIGWFILGFLALFIGVMFVFPYVNATKAELYLVLRNSALDRGICTPEELMLTVE
ncbi:MAG TPA: DUF975 family protein [Bacillota bacterium]|nr:DUF975 family protein [Bacillota bacterium]